MGQAEISFLAGLDGVAFRVQLHASADGGKSVVGLFQVFFANDLVVDNFVHDDCPFSDCSR